MKKSRPGNLALKVVNQYRRRDVLAYIALRYYLDNEAARTDRWARDISTDLVLTRSTPVYFPSQHFKEFAGDEIEHRTLFVPGANEALAEAALLEECEKHEVFKNPNDVFSYELADADHRSGVYVGYFKGLQARHDSIGKACTEFPDGVVRYLDIKKFYPNITIDLALSTWERYCGLAKLKPYWQTLGSKLLSDYGQSGLTDTPALLTGPMFSHLVANLVMRSIDDAFSNRKNVRYCRYVDDIVLVGNAAEVDVVLQELRTRVGVLGLTLHEEESAKSITVPSSKWLEGRDDFQSNSHQPSWLTLVRDLKQFLIRHPDQRESLIVSFRTEGLRIPVRDYSNLAEDADYLKWLGRMLRKLWFRRKVRQVNADSLLRLATRLRDQYATEFEELLDGASSTTGYDRKRLLPKLRFRGSRLIYLAPDDSLQRYAQAIADMPEMIFHAEVMNAVATGNVNKVIAMGTNVSQAVAQPLRAAGKTASTSLNFFPQTKAQSAAIFFLNGVEVDRNVQADNELLESSLAAFALKGVTSEGMRAKENPFIREVSCLHGLTDHPRHAEMFDKVFDQDEMLVIDAIDQLNPSASP